VQVDPLKPKLKPSGTKRLKLYCDMLLSTCAFNFNLRRYIEVMWLLRNPFTLLFLIALGLFVRQGLTLVHFSDQFERFVWDGGRA